MVSSLELSSDSNNFSTLWPIGHAQQAVYEQVKQDYDGGFYAHDSPILQRVPSIAPVHYEKHQGDRGTGDQ